MLGDRLTELTDSKYAPQQPIPLPDSAGERSWVHVATALGELTDGDHDTIARDSRYLLEISATARNAAAGVQAGYITWVMFTQLLAAAVIRAEAG